MSNTTCVTTDHDAIRRWIEARGGRPVRMPVEADPESHGCPLHVDFAGLTGEDCGEPVEWDEFFATFEEEKLAFVYQEHTAHGEISRAAKFVDRGRASAASQL